MDDLPTVTSDPFELDVEIMTERSDKLLRCWAARTTVATPCRAAIVRRPVPAGSGARLAYTRPAALQAHPISGKA